MNLFCLVGPEPAARLVSSRDTDSPGPRIGLILQWVKKGPKKQLGFDLGGSLSQ